MTALPAKQRPLTIAIRGTRPDEPGPERERARVAARRPPGSRCRRAGRRHPRRRTRPAAASARSARTGGPSCGARACPACRPAPCSRRRAPRTGARRRSARSRRAGRRRACWRSGRRARGAARWAAIAKRPYSTHEPGSTRSSTFSRAVRPPLRVAACATASGRAASSVSARRRSSSSRSVMARQPDIRTHAGFVRPVPGCSSDRSGVASSDVRPF